MKIPKNSSTTPNDWGDTPDKPKFNGRFYSWRVTLATQETKGTKDVLLVFSSGKREAVKEYLWLKFLWNQLSKEEFLLFIATLKESEEKKFAFLRRLNNYSKRELRERLNKLEGLIGDKISSKERLQGYYRLRIEIHKEIRRLPRTKKFTGWVRSASAIGSKKTTLVRRLDEMVPPDWEFVEESSFDWYSLLDVELLLATQLGISIPDET
jgi:DNA polymerase III delta prime subunit